MFLGFVDLEDTLKAPTLVLDTARTPVNMDAQPTVRIYGPMGLIAAATSLASFLQSGSVLDASNGTPIVIKSTAHNLSTGAFVTVTGVSGNTAANTTTTVTVVDQDHFSLDGTTGSGAYAAGGMWNVAGLYVYSVPCTSAQGFEAGVTYYALVTGAVAGIQVALQDSFIVT